jgi:hypothetical protein
MVAAIVGSVGLIALMYLLTVLARFGEKLGAVTKMRSYYYGYYAAIVCLILALLMRLIRAGVFWVQPSEVAPVLNSPWLYLFLHHLPLAIAMTLSLAVTWYYWSWLLRER